MCAKRLWLAAAIAVVVFLAAGCEDHMARKRQEARQRWAESRAEVVTTLARRAYERGQLARAREHLDPIIRTAVPYGPAYVLMARLTADQGHLDEARDYARAAVAMDADSAEAWYVLGTIEQTLGHADEALSAFGKAAGLAPDDPRYALAEAEMFAAVGHLEGARTTLASACERMPGSAALHAAYGDVLLRLGRWTEAAAEYRVALRLKPDDQRPRSRLAIALFRAGAWAEAEPILADLQAAEPEFATGWVCRMRADCLLALGRIEEARVLYRKQAETDPKAPEPWVALARCDILQDRLQDAQRNLEEALRRRPDLAEAHGLLGYVLTALGRPAEALSHLRIAANDPTCTGRETIAHLLARAERAAVTQSP